jgi:hypothetical protein
LTDRADPQDCPYVGLDPFEKTYEEFFFGREQDSRVLADHVMSRRVTVLYGPSGVGKSSVLNVGLPRELNERSLWTIITLRDWQDPSTIEQRAIDALNSRWRRSGRRSGRSSWSSTSSRNTSCIRATECARLQSAA